MAHFAKINENNKVIQVVVIDNKVLFDSEGVEQESLGAAFCEELFNGGTWIQTSYNENFRGRYAGIGDTYDSSLDRFIPIQPYPSWNLTSEFLWEPPVSKPEDDKNYDWDEETISWKEIA
jgi:hypothetical protein